MKYKINIARIPQDYVLVVKCMNDHVRKDDGTVLLYKPDLSVDTTKFARVVGIGERCEYFDESYLNAIVNCPEFSTGMHRVEGSKYAIREKLIMDWGIALFN